MRLLRARILAGVVVLALVGATDASAQRVSTWEVLSQDAPARDSVRGVDAADDGADVAAEIVWGAFIGGIAGLAGAASSDADPSGPFENVDASHPDATVFDALDFSLVGATSAALAVAAAEWARDRVAN
ncbi:MAG TPA: hypothetical protein VF039_02220 [Longimicrobiales bacterium]